MKTATFNETFMAEAMQVFATEDMPWAAYGEPATRWLACLRARARCPTLRVSFFFPLFLPSFLPQVGGSSTVNRNSTQSNCLPNSPSSTLKTRTMGIWTLRAWRMSPSFHGSEHSPTALPLPLPLPPGYLLGHSPRRCFSFLDRPLLSLCGTRTRTSKCCTGVRGHRTKGASFMCVPQTAQLQIRFPPPRSNGQTGTVHKTHS